MDRCAYVRVAPSHLCTRRDEQDRGGQSIHPIYFWGCFENGFHKKGCEEIGRTWGWYRYMGNKLGNEFGEVLIICLKKRNLVMKNYRGAVFLSLLLYNAFVCAFVFLNRIVLICIFSELFLPEECKTTLPKQDQPWVSRALFKLSARGKAKFDMDKTNRLWWYPRHGEEYTYVIVMFFPNFFPFSPFPPCNLI